MTIRRLANSKKMEKKSRGKKRQDERIKKEYMWKVGRKRKKKEESKDGKRVRMTKRG